MRYFVCTEAFAVTLYESLDDEVEALRWGAMQQPELDKLKSQAEERGQRLKIPRGEDKWFRAGQRVPEDSPVFRGKAGVNRMKRFFLPEDEAVPPSAEIIKRGPGRPRKVLEVVES